MSAHWEAEMLLDNQRLKTENVDLLVQRDALAEALRMVVVELNDWSQIQYTRTELLDAARAALAKVAK